MEKNTSDTELETGKAHTIVEVIEYVPIAVLIKTINKKSIGNISIMSFDSGEGLTEKTSPFDTFAQIVKEMLRLLFTNSKLFRILHGDYHPCAPSQLYQTKQPI